MTMTMIHLYLFALLLTGISVLIQSHQAEGYSSSPLLAYEIRPRPTRQLKWTEIEDEAKISFDGNVAAIQALALEKAAALADEGNTNDETDKGDDLELAVPLTCDGIWTRNVHKVSFQYMVEYDESISTDESTRYLQSTQIDEILTEIETEVQNKLADVLLVCNTESNEIKEANVVGLLARTPRDEKRETQPCAPEQHELDHSCVNVEGRLTLFLGENEKHDIATYLALFNTKDTIEDTSLITSVGRGLIKVIYLGPGPIAPYDSLGSADNSGATMSSASIAILSIGAAAAFVFLGGAFAWRRQFSKKATESSAAYGSPGASTRDVEGTAEIDEENGDPSSPLSRMIPSAYTYSDHLSILSATGLSAVEEATESEGTPSVNSTSGAEINAPACGLLDPVYYTFPMILFDTSKGGNPNEPAEDGAISDVSPCPSDESGEENSTHQQPNATTSLLLDISSPKGANTSVHEDEDLLFLS
eukprot:scaffold2413_cov171-Amphora_coffeaeformis.AAC.4